jgi:membrane protease YdiL (CAAX protease family)
VTASEITAVAPRYAGLGRRVAAGLLDLVVAWAAYSIAIMLLDPDAAGEYATTWETALAALILVAVGALWFGYVVFAQWRWGQTLGMSAVGIRVVGDQEQGLSWTRALVRTLLLGVDCVAGLFLIPLSRRKQRLGDRLANTVVLMHGDDAYLTGPGGSVEAGGPVTVPPPGSGGSEPPPGTAEEEKPRRVPATWGPGRVGVGILVLLVLSIIEVAIVAAFDPGLNSLGARLAAQALLAATLIGIAFTVSVDDGFPGTSAVPRWKLGLRPSLRSKKATVATAGAALLAYIIFAAVYSSLVQTHQKDITRDLGFGHGDFGTVAAALLIIVAAPISEEVFFRGFLFGGFRKRLSFPIAALVSAVIFGLFHYTGASSWTVVPQLAFLGFAFCCVYEETGSIYPTIALHMLNNTLAFIVLTS